MQRPRVIGLRRQLEPARIARRDRRSGFRELARAQANIFAGQPPQASILTDQQDALGAAAEGLRQADRQEDQCTPVAAEAAPVPV